ncbi:MAG: AMP-binding protein, partial [Gemmatimonadaceae bacterium]
MQTSASGGGRNSSPGTLNKLFFDAVEKHQKADTLQVKRNGAYQPISSRELADQVRQVALGLRELGINRGDRVAILSENRPEWAIADYACLTAGLTDVPIYPTLPPEQIPYILNDSGAVAVFVSTPEQAAKIAQVRGQISSVKHVIGFGDSTRPGEDLTFDQVRQKGQAVDNPPRSNEYRQQALSVKPDEVATLIYTSGTTGEPKGVTLTHDNIYSNVMAGAAVIPFGGNDTCLSFLPLSHIFERMAGHYL